jgi:hypothetical protein
MGEWKAGKLHSGSANGPIVKSQDQAIAIAYSEAYGMDKMLFGGMVNDLSDDIIDRMEGLVPISTLQEMLDNAKFIIADMYEEGFEKDEIMSFLSYKISQIGTGKMSNGGGVGSLAPNLLMELWYAVWERKTEKYDEIAKKLDKEGVSFTIQNKVSEDAQNTRSRKAIDTFEVQDRIKKIMGNTKMKTGGGVGSKNTDYIEVTNGDTVLSLEKSNGAWEEVDVLQGVKPVNFGRNTYKGNMKQEALLKALNAEYGGGYEVAYVYMKMSGGKMETGGGITATFEEWSKNYPIEKQADNFYRLYYTKNNFTIKYSKDKSKLEEYRKMMYDLHKSTKYSKGGEVITYDDGYQFKKVSKQYARENWQNEEIFAINLDDQTERVIESEDDIDSFDLFGVEMEQKKYGGGISGYKVGDVLHFKDGESWKVVKVKSNLDKLVIKPHNELAKKQNTSIEIDIDLDYLNNNLKAKMATGGNTRGWKHKHMA